jgi:hypothetical protein
MKDQMPLWHEDIYDALRTVVMALGGWKKVGTMLRPEWEEKPDTAGRWLQDTLNRDRAEKLDFDQFFKLLREGRAAGCHVAMRQIARECGYGDPQPVEPEDELADLQRQFIASMQANKRLVDRMEKLQSQVGGGGVSNIRPSAGQGGS